MKPKVLFVVPYSGELPPSFNIIKLEGDLVDILYAFRQTEDVIGVYSALTPDQLAVLIKERAVLHSPDLVMVTELGVDYPNSFMLYSEFMDLVSINNLEDELIHQGVVEKQQPELDEVKFGIKNSTAAKTPEIYEDVR